MAYLQGMNAALVMDLQKQRDQAAEELAALRASLEPEPKPRLPGDIVDRLIRDGEQRDVLFLGIPIGQLSKRELLAACYAIAGSMDSYHGKGTR